MHLSEIQIRDPFVLPVAEESAYYLFGSTDRNIWSGPGTGFDCYRRPLLSLRPWLHAATPCVADDGGHAMIFRRFDGGLVMTYHQPNRTPEERAVFVNVRETAAGLERLG